MRILKKIFLILTGFLLALILLETSLQTTGFALSQYQKYQNHKILKNKSKYVVMCIGESTTGGQYPVQLQQILNSKYPGKFSVIDCGRSGAKLSEILKLSDSDIAQYHPDIVLCMLGINDDFTDLSSDNKPKKIFHHTFIGNIKLYKLFRLLQEHLKSSKEINQDAKKQYAIEDNANLKTDIFTETQFQLAAAAYQKADYSNAEKIYKNLLEINQNNQNAYFQLFILYAEKRLPVSEETLNNMALKALDLGFTHEFANYYKQVIEYNQNKGDINKVKYYIELMLKEKMLDHNFFLTVFYRKIEHLLTPEQKEKISSWYTTGISPSVMSVYYTEIKDYDKAAKYFKLAEDLRINFPNEQTMKLYRLIVQKLIDNNIKVICMQYPVRSIKPLKNIFKDTPYYDKITFISNEEMFKQALKEKQYNEIFEDQFAGDFGHCTDYGNTLIAQNAAKTLTDLTK